MSKLFCIAAGQEHTRKTAHAVNKKHLYLNYGLLSLATLISKRGVDVIQIQGNFDEAKQTFDACNQAGLAETEIPIFVSIPSFYAVSWAKKFIALVKSQMSHRTVIVGGRWVVDGRPDLLRNVLEQADVIVEGLAEGKMDELFQKYILPHVGNKKIRLMQAAKVLSTLDYSLLSNRNQYQPSIEVSRGCGMGCSFCQEKDEPLSKLKPAEIILSELSEILISDDLGPMNPYFEASIFAPSRTWSENLVRVFKSANFSTEWRTEARVDSITPQTLEILAQTGLKVIDLGLESASLIQLSRMQKSKNPVQYLKKASALLKSAKANGIRVKVNILLFAGETKDTFDATLEWLETHRQYIEGVSVGPVMIFGWPDNTTNYLEELCSYGASVSNRSQIMGVQEINLSKEIDAQGAHELAIQASKRFMTAESYFFLKSFSYLPRSYKYSSFIDYVQAADKNFSFSVKRDLTSPIEFTNAASTEPLNEYTSK